MNVMPRPPGFSPHDAPDTTKTKEDTDTPGIFPFVFRCVDFHSQRQTASVCLFAVVLA